MSGSLPARGSREPRGGGIRREPYADGETLAWLLSVPFGLLLVAAIVLLGPPIAHTLFRPLDPSDFWPGTPLVPAEAREQAAYLLAILAAIGLSVAIVILRRPAGALVARGTRVAPFAQLAMAVLIVLCVVEQERVHYFEIPPVRARYFTMATWLVAAAIAAGVVLAVRSAPAHARLRAALRERHGTRWLVPAVAVAVTALAMLRCIDSDATFASHKAVGTILLPVVDETFAVVNGSTPFVDFQPPYTSLWPFVVALPLDAIAPTLLVFTVTLTALSVAGLLAVFGVLRRVTRNGLTALLLYVPFLAMSFVLIEGGSPNGGASPATYLPAFPLRYAGPYLLAWLTARTLDTERRWARRLLFAAAGLVVLNNANFGLPALGGTIAALLCATGPLRRPLLLRLAADAALGLLAATVALSALTLARAGALPDLTQLFAYGSVFARGFTGSTMPAYLGLHLIVYLTFAAALATAVVRAVGDAENRVLTGMLAWSGIFGLGAGAYFVAESGPLQLRIVFSSWALALALLAVVVVERLLARPRRRPSIADVAVLLGAGLMACSFPQLPRPWLEIERLARAPAVRARDAPTVPDPAQRAFLGSLADGRHDFYLKHGAPVALLIPNGPRIAEALGFVDVNRFASMPVPWGPALLRSVVSDLRRAGGNTILLTAGGYGTEFVGAKLASWGFGILTPTGVKAPRSGARPLVPLVDGGTIKWVDLRHLHPAALRRDRGHLVARYPPRG